MSAFVLKLVASLTMFVDHFGVTFGFVLNPENLRCIGRMSFPIYIFLISEGTRYTKDLKKYIFSLGIFAIISEIPYDMLFSNLQKAPSTDFVFFDFQSQNVFFTLFFGVLGYYFLKEFMKNTGIKRYSCLFFVIFCILAGGVFNTDYGVFGVSLIIICSTIENKNQRIIFLFIAFIFMYFGLDAFSVKLMLSVCFTVLLLFCYNGKRGLKVKWFFYAFYPLHLLLLLFLYNFYLR